MLHHVDQSFLLVRSGIDSSLIFRAPAFGSRTSESHAIIFQLANGMYWLPISKSSFCNGDFKGGFGFIRASGGASAVSASGRPVAGSVKCVTSKNVASQPAESKTKALNPITQISS